MKMVRKAKNTLLQHPLVILGFHGLVRDEMDGLGDFCFVHESKFRTTLKVFESSGWRMTSLSQGIRDLAECNLSAPSVAITFDDGFSSAITLGAEILREFKTSATIFLPTRSILKSQRLWFTDVIDYFQRTQLNSCRFLGRQFKLETTLQRLRASQIVQDLLKHLHPKAIEKALDLLRFELKIITESHNRAFNLLTWHDCVEAKRTGVFEFGAHSANHAIHTVLNPAEIVAEINESLDIVSTLNSNGPSLYAYPNGRRRDFSDLCVRELKKRKVLAALTTLPGWNTHLKMPYSLRRFCVGPNTDVTRFQRPLLWRFMGAFS